MTKTEEAKAILAKLLFDQNGMANSQEVVEAIAELVKAIVEKDE